MDMKEKIKQLIAANKLGSAIDLLLKLVENQDNDAYNTLIILKSRSTSNDADNNSGILSRDEYSRTKAQITNSVIQTMDRLDDSMLGNFAENANQNSGSGNTTNVHQINVNAADEIIASDVKNSSININVTKSSTTDNSKQDNKTEKSKILFLAANPSDQARVQTDKEYNAIRQRLGSSSQRDTYDLLMPEFALSIENLVKAMNQKPAIVHFSGHGEQEGILITNAANEAQLLPAPALLRLFKQHKDSTKLVVLNACHSAEQAKTISGLGFYVIGTNTAFSDEAAVSLATGLYIGLGEGKPVEQAYDDAMIVLMTNFAEDSAIPEIWKDGNKLDI